MIRYTSLYLIMVSTLLLCNSCGNRPDARVSREAADWVIVNGKILTVDDSFTIVEALAIKDSIIIASGSSEDILSHVGKATTVTDLEGKTVVPGLIDNHSHFVRAAKHWYRMVRWDDVRSRKSAFDLIEDRSRILPEGEWVIVLGSFILEQFEDDDSPFSLEELDRIFPDRPVFIQEGYARAFVNTATLKAAGFLDGDDQRYYDSIKADKGVLNARTQAYQIVYDAMPEPSTETWDGSLSMAIDSLLKMGLTTVVDMGGKTVTSDFYRGVERFVRNDEMRVRFYYTLNPQNSLMTIAEETQTQLQTHKPDYEDLQFAQFCFGETTYPPMRSSPFKISEEELAVYRDIVITAIENGWQIHEHSLQEKKVQQMLAALEGIAENYPKMRDLRFTIAHTDGMSRASIQKAIDLDMVFAVHSTSRLMTKQQYELGLKPPPARDINDLGGLWGLGSDGTTVASPNPFHTLGWIVSGSNIAGEPYMSQTVSRQDALRAHTASNAYLLFKESHLGSLEKGKRADFVVLNKDYMTVEVEDIQSIQSVMTVVDGQVMYEH